jgi:hypothetical protein
MDEKGVHLNRKSMGFIKPLVLPSRMESESDDRDSKDSNCLGSVSYDTGKDEKNSNYSAAMGGTFHLF